MADYGCEDWHAIHDRMPPGPATLRVTAKCKCPEGGGKLELRRKEPQGINPRDLLLELVDIEGEGGSYAGDCPVEYREDTDASYDTVSIVPDGPAGIPVEEVS